MAHSERPWIKLETITPEKASEYLTMSAGNRSIKQRAVMRYARDMVAGKWDQNGESIKFDRAGKLIDGHHRLRAIYQAQRPIDLLVVRGIKPGAMLTIDTGVGRSFADSQMVLGNGPVPSHLAPGLRWWWRYDIMLLSTNVIATHQELAEILEQHPHIADSARFVTKLKYVRGRCTPGVQTFVHAYAAHKYDRELADQFMNDLNDGAQLAKTNPIYHLRARLIDADTSHHRIEPEFVLALTVKAWNAWIEGRKIEQLKWNFGGEHPEAFPVFSVDVKRFEKARLQAAKRLAETRAEAGRKTSAINQRRRGMFNGTGTQDG